MSYQTIDETLQRWAKAHALQIATSYRDEEVRSIDVVGPTGRRVQIWIDRPEAGRTCVHVWDYRKRRDDLAVGTSDSEELRSALDRAYQTALNWIG